MSKLNRILMGDYIDIITDYHSNGAYKKLKENVELLDREDYAIIIRTLNFERNDFRNELLYVTEKAYNFLNKSYVLENDILMNKIANAGSTYIMPKLNKPVTCGMNLFLIRFNNKVNQRYMYYNMKNVENYIKSFSHGTTTTTITKDDVRGIDLYIHERKEQDKISYLLTSIDKKIENNDNVIFELEQIAKTIYDYWFLQFEFPNEEGKPYKSSGGKMVWNEELKREIPENWTVQRINSMAKLLAGGDKPKEVSSVKNNKYKVPIYANSNENRGLYGYTIEPVIKQKSITVTARGNIGYAILRTEPYVPIIRLISIIPKKSNYLKYLEIYINSYNFYKNGSIQQQLTIPQLETLKILCPEDKILNKFKKLMTKSVEIIEGKLEENQKLTKIKDYLLPLLMNGQVRFK